MPPRRAVQADYVRVPAARGKPSSRPPGRLHARIAGGRLCHYSLSNWCVDRRLASCETTEASDVTACAAPTKRFDVRDVVQGADSLAWRSREATESPGRAARYPALCDG